VDGFKTTIQVLKTLANGLRLVINAGFRNWPGVASDLMGAYSTLVPTIDNQEFLAWFLGKLGYRTTDHGPWFSSLQFRDSSAGGLDPARSELSVWVDRLAVVYAIVDYVTNSNQASKTADELTVASVLASKIARDLLKENGNQANLSSRFASGLSVILAIGAFVASVQASAGGGGPSGSDNNGDSGDRNHGGGGGAGGLPPLSLLPSILAPSFLIPNE